jgi:hypothetical protein
MVIGSAFPVIAGLAIGIAFVVLFSAMLKPDFMLSDKELISKYSELAEVKYFLEKHPEAKGDVSRSQYENELEISYIIEKQVAPPSQLYTGVNTFGIHIFTKPNQLSVGIFCGVYHGVTIGGGYDANINSIDEAEKNCFHIADREGVFEPDISENELNGGVFLSGENDADSNNGNDPPVSIDLPRYPTE